MQKLLRNYFDFTNKNVVILGGSKGIGLTITKELINLGATVIIVSRTKPNLNVVFYKCDFENLQEVKEVAKKIGFEAEIDHEDLSSAASSNADIWVAATDVANQLKDGGKENIISLKNIFDKASIEEQLKTFM